MGKTPHTDVAPLTVERTNPLSNHCLQSRLDAVRWFACGLQSWYGDLSYFRVRAEHLLHGTLAKAESLGNTSHRIVR